MELDAVLRFDEHYSQGAPRLPRVDELTGQNGLDRNRQRGTPAGSLEDGFSNSNTICIMDTRLFPRNSQRFTIDLRRLNFEFPISRCVDQAIANSGSRSAIEGLLVQLAYAVWQIRTGEVSCTSVQDMSENFEIFTKRCYLAKNVTLRDREHDAHEKHIRKYYGFIERYYLRMYRQELQEAFFTMYPRIHEVWDEWDLSLWNPNTIPQWEPFTAGGRVLVLERPQVICRYSSAPRGAEPRRSRSRSR